MMTSLDSFMKNTESVAIAGHVRPDGDCTGSCLAAYNYLIGRYPKVRVDLYLEPIPPIFEFLKNSGQARTIDEPDGTLRYDLFLALDCGNKERLGKAAAYFQTAKKTICVDHHISNRSFADVNYVFPHASSTSELIYDLMEQDGITKEIAECLYVGIIHDTGVFQYSCTSPKTMRIAGELMAKGIDYPRIVDETFFMKTYAQNRILGEALLKSELYLNGSCIVSLITKDDLKRHGAGPSDLEGIVSKLRSTKGVETSVFLYESKNGFKISLRSASHIDVAAIAVSFGGGGHCRAAGAFSAEKPDQILEKILSAVEIQQREYEAKLCTTES